MYGLEDIIFELKECKVVYRGRKKRIVCKEEKIQSAIIGPEIASRVSKAIIYEKGVPVEEYMIVLAIDNKANLSNYIMYSSGHINMTVANIPSILRFVLLSGCERFIVAHNHPSEEKASFSNQDIEFYKQLKLASDCVDLQLLDFIVLGRKYYLPISTNIAEKY